MAIEQITGAELCTAQAQLILLVLVTGGTKITPCPLLGLEFWTYNGI